VLVPKSDKIGDEILVLQVSDGFVIIGDRDALAEVRKLRPDLNLEVLESSLGFENESPH
jgi:hypothetical protein